MQPLSVIALAGVILALGVSSPTYGGEIPQSYLDADYRQCIKSSASKGGTTGQQQVYCECAVEELAKLDIDTYAKMSAEGATDSLSVDTQKIILQIAYKCNALMLD